MFYQVLFPIWVIKTIIHAQNRHTQNRRDSVLSSGHTPVRDWIRKEGLLTDLSSHVSYSLGPGDPATAQPNDLAEVPERTVAAH